METIALCWFSCLRVLAICECQIAYSNEKCPLVEPGLRIYRFPLAQTIFGVLDWLLFSNGDTKASELSYDFFAVDFHRNPLKRIRNTNAQRSELKPQCPRKRTNFTSKRLAVR